MILSDSLEFYICLHLSTDTKVITFRVTCSRKENIDQTIFNTDYEPVLCILKKKHLRVKYLGK